MDAASTWSNGTVYVIKNDVIWTLLASADQRGRIQTHSLDDLSICSWRICQGSDSQNQGNNSYTLADYSYTENRVTSAENYPCNGDARYEVIIIKIKHARYILVRYGQNERRENH